MIKHSVGAHEKNVAEYDMLTINRNLSVERRLKVKYCCTNDQRTGSYYFEFQKRKFASKYWLADSLYLSADIFDSLNLYQVFTEVIPEFNYYGITELDKEKWEQVKLTAGKNSDIIRAVITEIDLWASSILPTERVITVLGI